MIVGKFLWEDSRMLVGATVCRGLHEAHSIMPDVGADSEGLDLAACVFFHRRHIFHSPIGFPLRPRDSVTAGLVGLVGYEMYSSDSFALHQYEHILEGRI